MDTPVTDRSDLRKYRIELPNMADDADLDPYEFRLLVHYKRVGTCIEGTGTTARKTHMSIGKVSAARQSLADKGWIAMERIDMDKRRYRFTITVIDRWQENHAKYSKLRRPSSHETSPSPNETSPSPHEAGLSPHETSPSPHEASPSPHEASLSPHETKNKPIKNQPVKNEPIKNERDIAKTNFQKIWEDLEQLCGTVSSDTTRLINTWLEKHPLERIRQAIAVSRERGARSPKYVDQVMIGWEANGYPPSRSQQIFARAFKPRREQYGEDKPRYKIPEYSEADLAILDEIDRLSNL